MLGTGCLGGVFNNYIVACLNINNLANTLKLGETIPGPPFNDRCFQVEGICGVPCASDAYPPYCDGGVMDQSLLVSNGTETEYLGEGPVVWGAQLTVIDWIVLIVMFLDTFSTILRFMPVLSGRPTEMEAARDVQCTGAAVLGTATPIVAENEAILLRGLIGRTATAFHTVGSRHNINGLYVDTIVNEFRGKGEEKRLFMWCSWMSFLEVLASIKTKEMAWPNVPEEAYYGQNTNADDNEEMRAVQESLRLSIRNLLPESDKDPDLRGRVARTIRLSKLCTLEYNAGLSTVAFDGVSKSKTSERDILSSIPLDRINNGHRFHSPKTRTRSKSFSDVDNNDGKGRSLPMKPLYNLVDIMPLICFMDGWLEEIKHNDPNYNYPNKT